MSLTFTQRSPSSPAQLAYPVLGMPRPPGGELETGAWSSGDPLTLRGGPGNPAVVPPLTCGFTPIIRLPVELELAPSRP
jgi:hypothetical protein